MILDDPRKGGYWIAQDFAKFSLVKYMHAYDGYAYRCYMHIATKSLVKEASQVFAKFILHAYHKCALSIIYAATLPK